MGDREAFLLALAGIESQTERVFQAMRSGRWWTKAALAQAVGGSPHAMSARMSDLRKEGAVFQKKYEGGGVWLYRMVSGMAGAAA